MGNSSPSSLWIRHCSAVGRLENSAVAKGAQQSGRCTVYATLATTSPKADPVTLVLTGYIRGLCIGEERFSVFTLRAS